MFSGGAGPERARRADTSGSAGIGSRSQNWRGAAGWITLIVIVAFGCTGIAVLSAARKADAVARDHERQLVRHSLAEYQEQMLVDLRHAATAWTTALGVERAAVLSAISARGSNQLDFVLVGRLDAAAQVFVPLVGAQYLMGDAAAAFAQLQPPLDELDSRLRSFDGADFSIDPSTSALQMLGDRPALVAMRRLDLADRQSEVLVSVAFVVETFLRQVGRRLELPDLRIVESAPPSDDQVRFPLRDAAGKALGTLVWSAKHPSAEILSNILPYIGIALGCLLFLSGLVTAYMRHTRATIAAGEDRLRHMAMHDPLSGLPNRTVFGQRLEQALSGARSGASPAAVLSIDLDHFKDVNDTLGHHIGDALIAAVATRLARVLRDDDLVARLGGDEFAVITAQTVAPEALITLAQRIIEDISAPYQVAGHTILIGASIGVVVLDKTAQGAADVMRFADIALYRAKNEGRNRACIYDEAMNADLTQRKQLEADLRAAIESDSLTLAYQPLVSPDGERMVGVEALCRWPHPARGFVPPSDFIPIAELSGLIIPLGEWVLRQACTDGRAWPGLIVAVNVSPLQFRRPDFVDVVERILRETGFEANRLELELTESTLLGNVEGAGAAMRRLKALGVKLSLDDFGTGYSSLLYLRTFPFDKLKIDQGFVGSLDTTPDAAAIVHAVVSLGRGLGMKVTAEGVETAEQQLFLRAAGVHLLQGYRFGRPVDAAAIGVRLARQSGSRPPLRHLSAVAS